MKKDFDEFVVDNNDIHWLQDKDFLIGMAVSITFGWLPLIAFSSVFFYGLYKLFF